MITRVVMQALSVYIAACVLTKSSLFYKFREWFMEKTPWLKLTPEHPHFIECRLCLSFWLAVAVCTATQDWTNILPVYGLAYFLSTQERGDSWPRLIP